MSVSVFIFVNVIVLIIPLSVVIIAIVSPGFYIAVVIVDVVVVEYLKYLLVTSWCSSCSIAVAVATRSCVAVAVGSDLLCEFTEMYVQGSPTYPLLGVILVSTQITTGKQHNM